LAATVTVEELGTGRRREALQALAKVSLHLLEGHGRRLVVRNDLAQA
jgi:hypothetical protein